MYFSRLIILGLAALGAAHPGHEEAEHRHAVASRASSQAHRRALEGCAARLESRGVSARAAERRRATVARHREAKRIPVDGKSPASPYSQGNTLDRRGTVDVLRTDHEGAVDASAAEGDASLVFNSTTCAVLNPEGEVGPFYVLGEYVREDLTDGEEGVPLVADIQFVDVNTCEPLAGVCE